MMNKIVLAFLSLAMPLATMAQGDCKIKGQADKSRSGEYVYVTYGRSVADSAKIASDGSFVLDMRADDQLYSCGEKNSRKSVAFVCEKGTVKIDLLKGQIEGGKQNKLLSELKSSLQKPETLYEQEMKSLSEAAMSEKEKETKAEEIYSKAVEDLKSAVKECVKHNPSSQVAAYALCYVYSMLSVEEFFDFYDLLSEKTRQYPQLNDIYKSFEAQRKTAEGKMFVDFTIKGGSLSATDVSLSDFVGKGRYVLVDFWATWCGPCKREIPNLRQIYKDFGDKITVLSVAVWDKREATEKFIKQNDMPWNHIVDAQQIPTDAYGISGIPQIILFAPDGTIVKRDLRGEQIRQLLEEVLK